MNTPPSFRLCRRLLCLVVLLWTPVVHAAADYTSVEALFQKHCLDCHNAKDAEGQLILDSYDLLMKGGESGPSVVPGKSSDSVLVKTVEGTWEKDGKRKIMPPGAKRKKLDSGEIAILKAWIDAGAKGPSGPKKPIELITPRIPLKTQPRRPINSIAFAPQTKLLAIARYGEVELTSGDKPGTIAQVLKGHRGNVNALVFSSDGKTLFVAAGEPGLFGEIRQWSIPSSGTPTLVRVLEGHTDAIYSIGLSPDGKTLTTGSYDQKIKLWNTATGEEVAALSGHNGAVFGLAFRPDGKILASASADRTVKLWNMETKKRTDTLSQPLKEQYTVAFSPDGKRLYAAGADSRIRIWQISDAAVETTNPMLTAHFAHEGTILRIAFAPDGATLLSCSEDRTVKLWNTADLKQRRVLAKQPDWIAAAAFLANDRVAVGRMDGSLDVYDTSTGEAVTAPVLKAEVK